MRDSQEVEREEQERRRRKKEDKERKKELKQEGGGGGGTPSKMARLEQQLKQEPADQASNKSTRPSGLQVYPLQRYIVTPLSIHICEVFFSHYFLSFLSPPIFYRHL